MKAKLTVRSVEAIVPQKRDVLMWDSDLAGFGVKVTPAGRRSYFLYYRTHQGQQRRPSIGLHGAIKPEAAREIAKRWLALVAQGKDPSQERQDSRAAPNMKELAERYLLEHADTRKKDSSAANDRRLIEKRIVPAIGAKKVAAISRTDIVALHHGLRKTPYEANRTLALLSKMFSLGERWGLRPDGSNPAKNIDRFKEEKRERYLSSEEIKRLWSVLVSEDAEGLASSSALLAIKLLMLTGRRVNEVLKLEWSHVDLDKGLLRLPDTKSGSLTVAIGAGALRLLQEAYDAAHSANRDENVVSISTAVEGWRMPKYVIPGHVKGQPLVNIQKPWQKIRKTAALPDVRLHDLRHTYASVAAGLGMSLPLIGKLLGHKEQATTARYAHLSQDPIRVAAGAIDMEFERLQLGAASAQA